MQNKVKEFNTQRNAQIKPMNVYARLLDINSEMGELAKEYLKHSDYGAGEFELEDEFKLELGDVLYSLLSLADELGINAEECLDKVISKYQKRLTKSSTMGSEGE